MPIVAETEQIGIGEIFLEIQERKFLTDRGDGSSSLAKKISR
jgi:hypothetical protein